MGRRRLIERRVSALLPLTCLVLSIILALAGAAWGDMDFEWEQMYNGRGNGYDFAEGLAVDAHGNIYVTGSATGQGSGTDIVTIKYRADGEVLWSRRVNGRGNGDDYASALAMDGQGNIYVAGRTYVDRGDNDYDMIILKYRSDGRLLWRRTYNGRANSTDYATALAVDALGNVYVTGWSYIGPGDPFHGPNLDYITIKYNAHGVRLWVCSYDSGIGRVDMAKAITLDAQGNVYVTGDSDAGAIDNSHVYNMDYATIKYSPLGEQLWVSRYNHIDLDDQARAIAVDSLGNVIVTGYSAAGPTLLTQHNWDYATVKYNSDGEELWVSRYNGPGNLDDHVFAMAVDSHDNVYVTGSSDGIWENEWAPLNQDWATVKYNSDGEELWVSRYDASRRNDQATAIAVDGAYVYVTGWATGYDSNEVPEIRIIKYLYNGNELDTVGFGVHKGDRPSAIAVDALGNVCIAGGKYPDRWGDPDPKDYFIRKYSQ